jgi:flagellar motor switch protein FliG
MNAPRALRFAFDDLIRLDPRTLASVLRQVDANVMALALAGSRDELVDRICEQMPKRTARAFRRELRRLGPTRISDVAAAQRAVAHIAAQQLAGQPAALGGARL